MGEYNLFYRIEVNNDTIHNRLNNRNTIRHSTHVLCGLWKGEIMNTFIKASLIRAVRTIAQTAVAVIGTAFVLEEVNWWVVISASILAGILSILTSVATGLPEVDYQEHLHMSVDEPEDAEVQDDK